VDAGSLEAFAARARLTLPDGWAWGGAWAVDMRGHVDAAGWSYEQGQDFFEYPFPKGSDAPGPMDFVRRRRWVRRRSRVAGPSHFLPPLPPGGVAHIPRAAMPPGATGLRLQLRPLAGTSNTASANTGGGAAAAAAAAAAAPTLEEHAWGEAVPGGGYGSPLLSLAGEGSHWLACVPTGAYANDWRASPFWLGVHAAATPLSPSHADWRITVSPPLILENWLPLAAGFGLLERPLHRGPGDAAPDAPPPALLPRATFTLPPGGRRAAHGPDPRAALYLDLAPEGGWRAPPGRPPACIIAAERGGEGAAGLPAVLRVVDTSGASLHVTLEHAGGRMPHTLRVHVPFCLVNHTDLRLAFRAVPMPPRAADGGGGGGGSAGGSGPGSGGAGRDGGGGASPGGRDSSGGGGGDDDDDQDSGGGGDAASGVPAEQLRVVSTRERPRDFAVSMLARRGEHDSVALLAPACPGIGPRRWGLVLGTLGMGVSPPLPLDADALERSATLINAVNGRCVHAHILFCSARARLRCIHACSDAHNMPHTHTHRSGAKHQLIVRLAATPGGASSSSSAAAPGGGAATTVSRTRTLVVGFHVMIANHTGTALALRQVGTSDASALMLPPGAGAVPLVWPAANRPERLQLRAAGSGWSAPFALNTVTGQEGHIWLPDAAGGGMPAAAAAAPSGADALWLVRLEVAVRALGAAHVTFARAGRPPLLLRNGGAAPLRFRQALPRPSAADAAAAPSPWRPLPPHACIAYAWERPLDAHILDVAVPGGGAAQYRIGAGPAPAPQFGSGGSVNISGPSAEAGGGGSGGGGGGSGGGFGYAGVAGGAGLDALPPLLLPRGDAADGGGAQRELIASLLEEDGCYTLRFSESGPPGAASAALVPGGGDTTPRGASASALAPTATEWSLSLDVPDVVISIVDHLPEEILLASLAGLHVERATGLAGGALASWSVRLARCQIDDMTPYTQFPVCLYVRPPEEGEGLGGGMNGDGARARDSAAPEDDFLEFAATEKRSVDGRARTYPYIGLRATSSEVAVRVAEATLWRVAALWQRLQQRRAAAAADVAAATAASAAGGAALLGGASSARAAAGAPGAAAAAAAAARRGAGVLADRPMHVSLLSLSSLALRVSFRTAPDARPPGSLGALQGLGLTLANVDDTQLELRPVVLEGLHTRESAFWRQIAGGAARQLRGQVLRLLQGVDVLDNVSHALTAASAGVAALSFDPAFMARRRVALAAEERGRVTTISDGIRDGSELLARSLVRGVTGLLTKPVEGAREEGVEGFIKGVGRGILGIATQPMSGVLDLVSSTTAGLSASWDTVTAALLDERVLPRRRLPRAIRGDGVLRPYDEASALGQRVLRLATAAGGQLDLFRARGAARSDAYEGHVMLPGRRIALVTNRRLLLLATPEEEHDLLEDACSALWAAEWRDVLSVDLHALRGDPPGAPPAAIVVHLKRGGGGGGGAPRGLFDRRELKRVVHCARGTQQAAQLAALIAGARERALGEGGPNAGGYAMPRTPTRGGGGPSSSSSRLPPRPRRRGAGGGGGGAYRDFGDSDGSGADSDGGLDHLDMLSLGRDAAGVAGAGIGIGLGVSVASDDDEYGELAEPMTVPLSPLHPAATSGALAFTHASAPPPPSGGGPPALPCAGFTRLWCSRGAEAGPDGTFRPVSLWRPVAPPGYAILGDVAQTGYDPPRSPVATYRADDPASVALPLGFQLIWRDTGSGAAERVTLWQPVPPPGFAAVGCVAVGGYAEPERSVCRCVSVERVYASDVFEEATWRDGGAAGAWRCSIWQVDNDAGTFLARRAHTPPPAGLALGALLY
jgi:hypothetical protein